MHPPSGMWGTAARTSCVTWVKFSAIERRLALGRDVEQRGAEGAAGVVDHDVDAPEARRHLVDEGGQGGGVAHVEAAVERVVALAETVGPVAQGEDGPLLGEQLGRGGTDAGGRPGDEDDLALEAEQAHGAVHWNTAMTAPGTPDKLAAAV